MIWSELAAKLEGVSQRLKRGEVVDSARLAEELHQIARVLQQTQVPEPASGLMTTGEAADALGIRSVNTIKRWARQGLLEGFRRGGRVMVSRASVERVLASPALAERRQFEAQLDADLAAFDAGEADLPPTNWMGRKPWEQPRAPTQG